MNKYQVELYYGYEEVECGIYHSFKAVDPDVGHDDAVIARELAEQLDTEPECYRFSCDSMYIDLPESLIARVKADAIREYIEGVKTNGK